MRKYILLLLFRHVYSIPGDRWHNQLNLDSGGQMLLWHWFLISKSFLACLGTYIYKLHRHKMGQTVAGIVFISSREDILISFHFPLFLFPQKGEYKIYSGHMPHVPLRWYASVGRLGKCPLVMSYTSGISLISI